MENMNFVVSCINIGITSIEVTNSNKNGSIYKNISLKSLVDIF